jgi:RNA polymerase sigma-70 factor, ECF subfamily
MALPGELPGDDVLLARSAGGDRAAFDAFVMRHQAPVYRHLRALGAEAADAEDALQEAFLAAWKAASGYRGGASARGWLLTIARNALRRRHRRLTEESLEAAELERLGLAAGWGEEDTRPLERIAARELVDLGLAALDPTDREVLLLRDVEGLSGEETASLLGLSVAAMKSRLHRARMRFLAAVKEGV